MRRTYAVSIRMCLVLILLVSAVAAVPAGATPTESTPATVTTQPIIEDPAFTPTSDLDRTSAPSQEIISQPEASETRTINRTYVFRQNPEPGVVTARITYEAPPSVTEMVLRPAELNGDRVEITDTTGFVVSDDNTRWTWDRSDSTSDTPSVTIRYHVNQSDPVLGGPDFTGTGEWALFAPPQPILTGVRATEEVAATSQTTLADGTTGYATPTMVYLGPYEVTNGTRAGQQFTLVTPAAAPDQNASAIFNTLGATNRLYDVPGGNDSVVVFAGPDPLRQGGLTLRSGSLRDSHGASLWVHADSQPNSSIYIHEYIHTRQRFDTTTRMRWLIEAQASYYEALLPLYRGSQTYRAFHETVAMREDANRTLAPATRTTDRLGADYTKGARVLAALDVKIRAASTRDRSLTDVFQRMTRHDGAVSYAEFKDIVANVAGQRFDAWLDRYLTTSAVPPVPDNQSAYAPVQPGLDSDDDGLDTNAELANGTDPFISDTDGDGVDDGTELRQGTDPLTANTIQNGDESDPSLGTSLVVLGLIAVAGLSGLGALSVGAAKLLHRVVGVGPQVLLRRSATRLAVVAVVALAIFVALSVYFQG